MTPADPPAPPPTPQSFADARLAALMAGVAAADRRAFDELYRSTSAALFGTVLRICRDRGQAEEVLQEVYITVWRRAAAFDAAQGRVLPWLTAIARHRAIDALRHQASQPATVSRHGGLDDDEDGDLLALMPSDQPGPLDLLDNASRAHALERCMGELSHQQRSSLALAYYQGLSHAEVAEHMRQPLGSVKSWVRRGLQSLRLCLDRAAQRVGAMGRVA
ncbi:sigma-70 family RNA polymerase sigma factor [Roseateles asaccharophilus]|uniref:RNA polymerase sigma factor n=1 Tax=Roseateles asaccharophilus TaxID=582607 RepID=A0ABU2A8R7_9BURK|nr:sigma-70 family RNA polymerase sigma factor [Roseateles asaccharophilus]MDR7332892.1 RNA polymerase sigma-70 factor (ECF subfamily) [Roseateles asaccharophilus]